MNRRAESINHKIAKSMMIEWLRAASPPGADEGRFGDITWRHNRKLSTHRGVWEEYPVTPDMEGLHPVWDEYGADYAARAPILPELRQAGRFPLFIWDVALQHKGAIKCVIEIVHANPMNAKKAAWMRGSGIETYEVPAAWVLRQRGSPGGLPLAFRR